MLGSELWGGQGVWVRGKVIVCYRQKIVGWVEGAGETHIFAKALHSMLEHYQLLSVCTLQNMLGYSNPVLGPKWMDK